MSKAKTFRGIHPAGNKELTSTQAIVRCLPQLK